MSILARLHRPGSLAQPEVHWPVGPCGWQVVRSSLLLRGELGIPVGILLAAPGRWLATGIDSNVR